MHAPRPWESMAPAASGITDGHCASPLGHAQEPEDSRDGDLRWRSLWEPFRLGVMFARSRNVSSTSEQGFARRRLGRQDQATEAAGASELGFRLSLSLSPSRPASKPSRRLCRRPYSRSRSTSRRRTTPTGSECCAIGGQVRSRMLNTRDSGNQQCRVPGDGLHALSRDPPGRVIREAVRRERSRGVSGNPTLEGIDDTWPAGD